MSAKNNFQRREAEPAPQVTADGYVRHCPVQTLREAENYRLHLAGRIIGAILLVAAVIIGFELLTRLGFFGR